MNRTPSVLIALALLIAGYLLVHHRRPAVPGKAPSPMPTAAPPAPAPPRLRVSALRPQTISAPPTPPRPVAPPAGGRSARRARPGPPAPVVLPFHMEDGVAVTLGDVVMGVPADPALGRATLTPLAPWRGTEVAYYIQPDLVDPDRVRQALTLFAGTPIHFVEFTTQDDVLVFEPGTGACKSYVGRIGGKQPVWLSPGCGPVEIAHEIMHALGFVHEQNRDDRDGFVRVLAENIEPGQEINFERLPATFMRLSGLGPFDYQSVMIYPKTMFGVGGRDTLESLLFEVDVDPARGLSDGDRRRLEKAFGH